MKFERGRKKNQLIWSFILKDIASQSLVKILFLNKTEKEKKTFRINEHVGDVLWDYASTYASVDRRWVTDSGSRGPTGQV